MYLKSLLIIQQVGLILSVFCASNTRWCSFLTKRDLRRDYNIYILHEAVNELGLSTVNVDYRLLSLPHYALRTK